MSKNKSDSENEGKEKPIIVRNTTDLQRLKLEKLMKNPVSTFNGEIVVQYSVFVIVF